MSRGEALEGLLRETLRFSEHAARDRKVLEGVIQNLRRPTNAQEVDALHASLADLLTGVAGVLSLGDDPC